MKNTIIAVSLAIGLVNCTQESNITKVTPSLAYDLSARTYTENFEALPKSASNTKNKRTAQKIALGHRLYYDTQLSLTGKNSCNSCHNLATYGVDNKPTSTGDNGGNGDRNSPTVLNAALHSVQFWDGRAKDIEEQAGMPILNPVEMAIPNEDFLIKRLKGIPSYVEDFKNAYPNEEEPLTFSNLQNAIGLFERELLTPSRFDQFLAGNDSALTLQEKKGFISFNLNGCVSCHSGAILGGQQLQKFGLFEEYIKLTGSERIDYGKFEVSADEKDKFIFKVPSLRNIEKTAPYFHDGSVNELKDAVQVMAQTQLGKKLSPSEVENITAFLKSLTGTVPKEYQKAPKMY